MSKTEHIKSILTPEIVRKYIGKAIGMKGGKVIFSSKNPEVVLKKIANSKHPEQFSFATLPSSSTITVR